MFLFCSSVLRMSAWLTNLVSIWSLSFSKLGFTKVKAPNSHNRKRLAIESRRHASPDDSHMFIIKLPPNMYYYTNPKASSGSGTRNAIASSLSSSLSKSAEKSSSSKLQQQHFQLKDDSTTKDANGKKVRTSLFLCHNYIFLRGKSSSPFPHLVQTEIDMQLTLYGYLISVYKKF